jgi:hypothetical protein
VPPPALVPASMTWRLPRGVWVELELRLGPGGSARAAFTADAPLAWDVHHHETPERTLVHHQGVDATRDVRFAPGRPGTYFYRWENAGPAELARLAVELTLTGDARLVAIRP